MSCESLRVMEILNLKVRCRPEMLVVHTYMPFLEAFHYPMGYGVWGHHSSVFNSYSHGIASVYPFKF